MRRIDKKTNLWESSLRWSLDKIVQHSLQRRSVSYVQGPASCSGGAVRKFFRWNFRPRQYQQSNEQQKESNVNWAIFRPVLSGLDTLTNVKYNWSLEDLLQAHEALDIKEELEAAAFERAKK